MRKSVLCLGFVLVSFFPVASHAGYWTGIDMKNWSDAYDRVQAQRARSTDYQFAAMLSGYVSGVVSTLDEIVLCPPNGVTVAQLNAIVEKYLSANPEQWNQGASDIVVAAIRPVFPCHQKK